MKFAIFGVGCNDVIVEFRKCACSSFLVILATVENERLNGNLSSSRSGRCCKGGAGGDGSIAGVGSGGGGNGSLGGGPLVGCCDGRSVG